MASELKPWKYDIQYGPEGEANYAWVYDDQGVMVATMKTHKAKQIVDAMNSRPTPTPCDELVTVGFRYSRFGKIPKHHSLGTYPLSDGDRNAGFSQEELVTRQNAEEVIAAKDADFKKLEDAWYEAEGKISDLEADNKRLREALETLLKLNDDSGPFGGEIYQDRVDRAWENARAALGEVKL